RLHADAGFREESGQSAVLRQLLESRDGSAPHPLTLFRWHWFEAHKARRRADWEAARSAAAAMLAVADQHRHRPYHDEATAFQLGLRALSEPAAALPELRLEVAAADPEDDMLRHGRLLAALTAAAAEAGLGEEA